MLHQLVTDTNCFLVEHSLLSTHCLLLWFLLQTSWYKWTRLHCSAFCQKPNLQRVKKKKKRKEDSQTGWSGKKIKGNIYQHCVAGQNAIRDRAAESNWVWHMLIAFHLDKFGCTVCSWTGGQESEWILLENKKSLCCCASACCQICVKSPPTELQAWLLPRNKTPTRVLSVHLHLCRGLEITFV